MSSPQREQPSSQKSNGKLHSPHQEASTEPMEGVTSTKVTPPPPKVANGHATKPVEKKPKNPKAAKQVVDSLTNTAWTQYGVSVQNWNGQEIKNPKFAKRMERKMW